MSSPAIYLVDDEEHPRRAATQLLDLAGHQVKALASAEDALPLVSREFGGIVITDIRMPGMSGLELLEKVSVVDPDLPVILITGHGDVALAVEAMQLGAYDFIEKPFSSDRILESVSRALEKRKLTLELRRLRDTVASRWDNLEARLIGRSNAMLAIRDQIRAIAPTGANVLVIGETGTGKEVVARAIHDLAHEKERPFVAINCAALPPEMIEQELFGYEAGAFPGATRARFGKFEHARNGTIFFDGIEFMPLEVQSKLVRVIEERKVTRLGAYEPVDLNARFIASSKVDLEEAAEQGRFRHDLLYQLSVVTLKIPSLAERRSDIPALFVMLTRDAAARNGLPAPEPGEQFLSNMAARDWPGNVRELRNAAERLVLGIGREDATAHAEGGSLSERMAAFEKQVLTEELKLHHGRLKPVYEALELSRKSLYEKMQKHGLDRNDFRDDED